MNRTSKQTWRKPKCSFVKMGNKVLQLNGKKRDDAERKKILEDRKKREAEWRKW